jgi:hypothetical protein
MTVDAWVSLIVRSIVLCRKFPVVVLVCGDSAELNRVRSLVESQIDAAKRDRSSSTPDDISVIGGSVVRFVINGAFDESLLYCTGAAVLHTHHTGEYRRRKI